MITLKVPKAKGLVLLQTLAKLWRQLQDGTTSRNKA
jgi:hypothetical protein